MRALPLSIGTIHFVGIGGIGMSGIAEILHNLGYSVQGSDSADGANTQRLTKLGIPVRIGQGADNLGNAQVVVVSSAIRADNPELQAARQRLLPVVRRAEMLGELMRLKWSIAIAGTHGKTTTTSMVGALLDAAKFDPTVINGGIINSYGTNARLGAGDWMVVEADESDGTFIRLPATIGIVTNIDPEHLDFYGNYEAVQAAFDTFVGNIPFYGFAALCLDHPAVQGMIPRVSDRRIVTYGFSPQADVRAVDVVTNTLGAAYDVVFTDRATGSSRTVKGFRLPMFGLHNVQNSLAAIAVGSEMGIPDETLRTALAGFEGVKRRFTKTGISDGITVVDDYGHHPVEIAAVLRAARQATGGSVIAVVQPHRYTRLRDLFDDFCRCFNDADTVIVADVYPAGESPILGIHRDALVEGLLAHGHRNVLKLESPQALARIVRDLARPGDFVVCLGAGSITNWANALPGELDRPLAGSGKFIAGSGPMMPAAFLERLIDRLPPVRGRLTENAPLAPVTWFRVGGPAEVLFRPADRDDLAQFLANLTDDIPVSAIGVASNLLVRDGGVPGVVIRLGRGFAEVTPIDGNRIAAGAGALDGNVALTAAEAGLAGLEFLSGIPGTIGGALRMNAGAYGSDIKEVLVSATAIDGDGQIHELSPDGLDLTYRHCGVPEDWIFLGAVLQGQPASAEVISGRMAEIRQSREATQPVHTRTGGSTFANPPGAKAWQLIDQAGCRGLKRGAAMVSELHANFLINLGDATASDIEGLGEEVRRRVFAATGVTLDWEIRRIGRGLATFSEVTP